MVEDRHATPSEDPSAVRAELQNDRFVGKQDLVSWNTRLGRFLARLVERLSALLGPHAALILTLAVGAIIVTTLTFASSEVYDAVTEADGVAGLDHPVLQTAMSLRSPVLNTVATAYTDVAGVIGMPILALAIMITLALKRRSWTPVILLLAAAAGSLSMTVAGKQLIGRARPPLSDSVPPYEYSASFPSGHTLNATVIAGTVAYLLILRQSATNARVLTIVIAAAFAFTIGLSRMYLGHHWFTDVLVAWTLGIAWLALVITAHRLYLTARHRSAKKHGIA